MVDRQIYERREKVGMICASYMMLMMMMMMTTMTMMMYAYYI
jgi:hypothetical protein